MDRLWAAGWRHFGAYFFRYSLQLDDTGVRHVTPLRLDLTHFVPSKSQRRVLRRNADLRTEFRPASFSVQAQEMFQRHKERFRQNMPEGLETFISTEPATVPCECLECRIYTGPHLIAVSYLDLGEEATSAVYGMFEPHHGQRSLGTYTMLREIEFSRSEGRRWYYLGYATEEPSAYDYKKKFAGLQALNWDSGEWRALKPQA
jgi:arginine-tRNA-protein transferase